MQYMSSKFSCPRCGYCASTKQHMRQHVNRKNICEAVFDELSHEQLLDYFDTVVMAKPTERWYHCDVCSKRYATPQAKYSHKMRCIERQKKQKSAKLTLEQMQKTIEDLKAELKAKDVIQRHHHHHHQNNSIYIGQQNNIVVLNNFGNETYSHITDEFLKQCLQQHMQGIKALIEKIHFSPEALENKNVRMKSLKHNQVEVANERTWIVRDANETTDAMIKKGSSLLKDYYSRELAPLLSTLYSDDCDVQQLDMKLEMFLATILHRNEQYYDLRRSVLNLIIHYSEQYNNDMKQHSSSQNLSFT